MVGCCRKYALLILRPSCLTRHALLARAVALIGGRFCIFVRMPSSSALRPFALGHPWLLMMDCQAFQQAIRKALQRATQECLSRLPTSAIWLYIVTKHPVSKCKQNRSKCPAAWLQKLG